MVPEKRFLVDVGLRQLPFPIRVCSRNNPDGQPTVANISISARIMQEFEARWIDRFIQILHRHRDRIGTKTVRQNLLVYYKELKASFVKGGFEFPFFVEKSTPLSGEKCLVQYLCRYEAEASFADEDPKVRFHIEIPCITTYPASRADVDGGLFGQLSHVSIEVETKKEVFPEDFVALVDRHALAPVYSYLSEEEQLHLIRKIHDEAKTSVVMTDAIKQELARDKEILWYSVRTQNFGMLHSYSTVIGTEKSMWVPMSSHEENG